MILEDPQSLVDQPLDEGDEKTLTVALCTENPPNDKYHDMSFVEIISQSRMVGVWPLAEAIISTMAQK
jgi:hypothetical protein